jgi:hypothetical protein
MVVMSFVFRIVVFYATAVAMPAAGNPGFNAQLSGVEQVCGHKASRAPQS